jgi:tRNA (Thr-GGU) A37 N-methylase
MFDDFIKNHQRAPEGKRKPRFSLSEEQKATDGLFATLSKMRPNQ